MAGCYGSSFEDRYWENKLINHLDACEHINYCESCEREFNNLIQDDDGYFKCERCKEVLDLQED